MDLPPEIESRLTSQEKAVLARLEQLKQEHEDAQHAKADKRGPLFTDYVSPEAYQAMADLQYGSARVESPPS